MEIITVTQFRTPTLVVLLNIFILGGPVSAQETEGGNTEQSQPNKEIEEVVVTAPQLLLHMRAQIETAEKRIYSKYNALNQIDDYDIKCKKSSRNGSHIIEQTCMPVFFKKAVAEGAQNAILEDDLSYLSSQSRLRSQYSNRFEAMYDNLVRVALENPELESSLRDLHPVSYTHLTLPTIYSV